MNRRGATVFATDGALLQWAAPAWLKAVVRYGCVLSMLPVTAVSFEDLDRRCPSRAYARSGLRELEDFLRHP